jgi:hypothetical protein
VVTPVIDKLIVLLTGIENKLPFISKLFFTVAPTLIKRFLVSTTITVPVLNEVVFKVK